MRRRATACAAVIALLLGAGAAAPAVADAPTQAPDIDVNAVVGHLEELQSVAEANGGNRAAGEPGYDASVDYVVEQLENAGYTVERQKCPDCTGQQENVIAQTDTADSEQVVMLGGHLDGVVSGAGINDNGSGSAALLEIALTLAEQNPELAKNVRFAWWAAEETGLEGSSYYVQELAPAEQDRIEVYLNFDMLGSPNAGYFVYEGEATAAGLFHESLAGAGVEAENIDLTGSSDHTAFERAGVPVGGLFTGAGSTKTAEQAEKWGGTAGEAFDSCYHRSCDDMGNIDETALDRMTDTAAFATWSLAAG